MKQLWRYISPHSLYIFFTVLIKLAGALLELLIPFFMEIILDDVVPAGQTGAIYLYGSLMAQNGFYRKLYEAQFETA